jgi:hypothetical protein
MRSGAIIASVGLAFLDGCSPSVESAHVRASDEQIVNKALDIYGHGKVSREDLRRSYDINVVYLPQMTCVGFNLKPGTAGGDDALCLDKAGQRVVLQYTNGD